MGKKKKSRSNVHHVLPKSRGGTDEDNTVTWPVDFHAAYHTLFGNLTLEESEAMIREMSEPGSSWTWRQIYERRLLHKKCTEQKRA